MNKKNLIIAMLSILLVASISINIIVCNINNSLNNIKTNNTVTSTNKNNKNTVGTITTPTKSTDASKTNTSKQEEGQNSSAQVTFLPVPASGWNDRKSDKI